MKLIYKCIPSLELQRNWNNHHNVCIQDPRKRKPETQQRRVVQEGYEKKKRKKKKENRRPRTHNNHRVDKLDMKI